jgi:hypothetical protein
MLLVFGEMTRSKGSKREGRGQACRVKRSRIMKVKNQVSVQNNLSGAGACAKPGESVIDF